MKASPIAKYARQETRARVHRWNANLRHAAKHPDDPDAIHDLRVSIRRLSQCFRIFQSPAKKVRRRVHKIMQRCGAVRNCDIALELLAECGLLASPSVAILQRSRERAARKLKRSLKKERRRSRAAESAPHPFPGFQIATRLPALAEDFFQTGDAAAVADSSYATLHRFRLRAKRFRYTLELFERFYGSEMATGAKALKGVQDLLGAINDCVTTIALLPEDPIAQAAIQELLDERTRLFRNYWRSRFPPQKRAWWRRWLSQPRASAGARVKATSTASSGSATRRG
ncbi:MAG: CHAD domain-containing protein [Acidobacteriota bacterium]|nr:CHAD domain-containing protein [Acidobacteriota bacterium]